MQSELRAWLAREVKLRHYRTITPCGITSSGVCHVALLVPVAVARTS
jgi:lipoate-protein ligase B